MKKSFIAAAIVGFATLGTAQASETTQGMHFMSDHEMHMVSGAWLVRGFSYNDAMQYAKWLKDKLGFTPAQHKRLKQEAHKMASSKKRYTVSEFKKRMLSMAGSMQAKIEKPMVDRAFQRPF
jgi:hypothetical protein